MRYTTILLVFCSVAACGDEPVRPPVIPPRTDAVDEYRQGFSGVFPEIEAGDPLTFVPQIAPSVGNGNVPFDRPARTRTSRWSASSNRWRATVPTSWM